MIMSLFRFSEDSTITPNIYGFGNPLSEILPSHQANAGLLIIIMNLMRYYICTSSWFKCGMSWILPDPSGILSCCRYTIEMFSIHLTL